MKNNWVGMRIFIFLFIASMFLLTSESFAAPKKSKISISVKDDSEKNKDDGQDETERENSRTETVFQIETEVVTLAVSIKNGEDHPVSGKLKWIFVSDHSSGKTIVESPEEAVSAVFSPGSKEITLEPLSTLKETVFSEPFVYEERTVETESFDSGNSSSRNYIKGDVYKGYLVLFIVDGQVVALKSNSSRYKKDEWIQKCR